MGIFLLPLLLLLLAACTQTDPRLPRLPADAVILAFGDSLTRGVGAGEGQGYPDVLATLTGRRVINAGIPGEVSAQGLERLPGVLDKLRPDLLILCHGGNDLLRRLDPARATDNLKTMIREAHVRGIPVVLIGVPKPGIWLETAAFYGAVAAELDIPLEDEALTAIIGDTRLKADQVHPNAAGYRRLAEAIYELLKKTGAV